MERRAVHRYEAVVIGVSAGGVNALSKIIPAFPEQFPLPVLIVHHRGEDRESLGIEYLKTISPLVVKEVVQGDRIEAGAIYLAPGAYHLLVEKDFTLSLSVDEMVQYSRPSIDVLFESAADAYEDKLIGIVLTGANADGAEGLRKIKKFGGLTIVENPDTAYCEIMPAAALKLSKPDHVLNLEEISPFLASVCGIR